MQKWGGWAVFKWRIGYVALKKDHHENAAAALQLLMWRMWWRVTRYRSVTPPYHELHFLADIPLLWVVLFMIHARREAGDTRNVLSGDPTLSPPSGGGHRFYPGQTRRPPHTYHIHHYTTVLRFDQEHQSGQLMSKCAIWVGFLKIVGNRKRRCYLFLTWWPCNTTWL